MRMVTADELELARAKRELEVDMAVDAIKRIMVDMPVTQKRKVVNAIELAVSFEESSHEVIN